MCRYAEQKHWAGQKHPAKQKCPCISLARGQIFTADAMLAFVFLIALLGLYFSASNSVSSKFAYDSARFELNDASETAMSAILSSSYLPNPDQQSIVSSSYSPSASLLDAHGFLSSSRADSFSETVSTSPERGREMLGLFRDGGGYDFSLSISDFSGSPITRCSSADQPALESVSQSQRFAVLDDGRPVKITLSVWKK